MSIGRNVNIVTEWSQKESTVNESALGIAARVETGAVPIRSSEISILRKYLESFLDPMRLEADISDFEAWGKENSAPLLQAGFEHRPPGTNSLTANLWGCRYWETEVVESPEFPPRPSAIRVAQLATSLAVVERHSSHSFDKPARKYLGQRLQDPHESVGAAHEVRTAAFFIRKGASVIPDFLVNSAERDLTLHWSGQEIPVQCKAKRPGAGRVIPVEQFLYVAGCMARDASKDDRKILVTLGTSGPVRESDLDGLRTAVRQNLGNLIAPELVRIGDRAYTVQVTTMSGSLSTERANSFLMERNFHEALIAGLPTDSPDEIEPFVAIGLHANPEEHPWRSLRDSIQEARDQLKNDAPGFVAVHYSDHVSDHETLRDPQYPSLLHAIVHEIQESSFVEAVLISSEPNVQRPGDRTAGQVKIYSKRRWLDSELWRSAKSPDTGQACQSH